MKAKIELNQHQIAEAIEEYMTKRQLKAGPGCVQFKVTQNRDAMDRLTGGNTVTATVEVEIGTPTAY